MLEALSKSASDSELRLFAASCCRVMWPYLTDARLPAGALPVTRR